MKNKRHLAYLALIGNAIIWGAALPLAKPALSHVSPTQFLAIRYAIASLIMLPVFVNTILKHKIPKKVLPKVIILELIVLCSLWLVYAGLDKTSALQASLILNTRPIIITFAGIFLLHEIEELHEWAGLVLSVIGITILVLHPLIEGTAGMGSFAFLGTLIILGANLLMATNAIGGKVAYKNVSKTAILSVSSVIGLALFWTFLGITNHFPTPSQILEPSVLTVALYMGILGTPIAFGLRYVGFSMIEASEATLFTYLQPVIYIPLTVLWLGESINIYQIVGLIIVITGVIMAEMRPKKSFHKSYSHHS